MISSELREEFTNLLHAHVPSLHITGSQATGHVPWREDAHPSFSADLEKGVWYDLARKEGGGVKEFKARLRMNGTGSQKTREVVDTYDYQDESGTLLFQVVRYEPKGFAQRRPDGRSGWVYDLKGARRVLYHLPRLCMADTVYIVEGEQDADRLWSLGFPATTNPQGAGKWREEYNESLRGKRVVILPDNDEPGEQHAVRVAHTLVPVAAAVKIVRLPGLPAKGDVSDWLDTGHTREELAELVRATPLVQPEDLLGQGKDSSDNAASVLRWYTVGQLRSETSAEMHYLVDNLLAESSLSVIGGKIAVGKSTLARTLARCIMPGGPPFLGYTTKHGAVLYVAPEESRHGVMKDLEALGFTDADPLHLCFASSPDVLHQVAGKMQETRAVLVIFETIFRVLKIKDVNDYGEATQKLDPILALARQTAAHVLFTHHLGKADREYALDALLGSTAIGGTPDTRIILKRKGDMRTVEVIQRYGSPLPETVVEFAPETKFISIGRPKAEHDESLVRDAILECLKSQEEDREKGQPLTEAQINEEVEGRNAYKRTALRSLVKDEKVEKLGKGGKKDPFRYCFKDSRFSCPDVPNIYEGQGDKNEKEDLSPQETDSYSCPRDSSENDSCPQHEEWEEIE